MSEAVCALLANPRDLCTTTLPESAWEKFQWTAVSQERIDAARVSGRRDLFSALALAQSEMATRRVDKVSGFQP